MTDGDFPLEYLDSIFQSSVDFPDIYVAYCFAMIDAWIQTGKVLTARLDVGYEPLPDKEIKANNAILQTLPWPFHAEFMGARSAQDRDDGYLKWTEPIEFGQVIHTGEEVIETRSPRQVALEVGTTKADRTIYHIREGGVARWPYESFSIFLFMPCRGFVDEIECNRDQEGFPHKQEESFESGRLDSEGHKCPGCGERKYLRDDFCKDCRPYFS